MHAKEMLQGTMEPNNCCYMKHVSHLFFTGGPSEILKVRTQMQELCDLQRD